MSETVVEQFAEDEFPDAFPGLTLSHLLTITTRGQLASAIGVLQAVGDAGGEVAYLRMIRCGDGLRHELKLCGLGPRQARLLSECLAALPGVDRATIEHQLLRG